MRYAIATCLLILAGPAWGQPPVCEAPSRPGSGRLCTTLAVEDGRLALTGTPTLVRASLPGTIADAAILDSLRKALQRVGPPYQAGMSKDEKDADASDTNPKRVALRTMTAPWETYVGAAADADIDLEIMLPAISGLLGDLRQQAGFVTVDDPNLVFNTETGDTQLDVVAITANVDIRVAGIAGKEERADALRSYLKPLIGRLWEQPALIARLKDYYAFLGLTPEIAADPRTGAIEIVEGTRIREVNLPPPGTGEGQADERDRMKALYALLDDRDFRRWLRSPPADNAVGYARDLGYAEGAEPYFFPTRAQVQQLLLAGSGLALQPLPTPSRQIDGFTIPQQYIVLSVIRPSPGAENAPPPAAAGTDELGLIDPNDAIAERAADKGPQAAEPQKKPERERRNYAGGGFEYRPGQGLTLIGLYQRSRLNFPLRDSSLGVRASHTGNNLFSPSVNYFADYVLFERLRRRVSLQLNGSSDATANRFLDDGYQDVRRAGGLARVEIEGFRDRGGRLLRIQIEGARTSVTRTPDAGPENTENLTAADIGLLFLQESLQTIHPWRAGLQPVVRWAPGAGREPAFLRFRTGGDFHIQLARGFEIDFAGTVQAASADTPVFELPALGGVETVRGFRADAALGRFMWATQSELWMPVPFRGEPGDGFGDFLRRVVRLAFFVDAGGMAKSASGFEAGTRSGPGAGLRLNFNPVLLRLDYAHGFGADATSSGRNKFYLSVKTNLPF